MTAIQMREKRERDELRDKIALEALRLFTMDRKDCADLVGGAVRPLYGLVAEFCYNTADAFLRERDKRTKS